MAKPKSVYLTDATMAAVRGEEALSGRVNQVFDRLMQIVEANEDRVNAMFTPAQRQLMLARYAPMRGAGSAEIPRVIERLAAALAIDSALAERVDDLSVTDGVVLLESLEAELADPLAQPPATHSQALPPATHS